MTKTHGVCALCSRTEEMDDLTVCPHCKRLCCFGCLYIPDIWTCRCRLCNPRLVAAEMAERMRKVTLALARRSYA